jgi:hypothetical protein
MSKQKQLKVIVDTNVPKKANLAIDPMSIPDDLVSCVKNCVASIEQIIKNGGLVLDANDEIFNEYRGELSLSGQPGVGDKFLKWVHYSRFGFPESDRVSITPNEDSYDEFPEHQGLTDFDISDRKFVAVANAHPDKPMILEATDSKWWGWKEALLETGIAVNFLCPDYIKAKYQQKMGK